MGNTTGRRSGVLAERKPRPDAWTKAARSTFLLHLAATCNVIASCRTVGKSPAGLYKLRARDGEFAREWDLALEQGYQRLEAELLRRAMGGAADGRSVSATDTVPEAPLDVELAMKLLALRRSTDRQGRRKPVHLKQPSATDVLTALDRKLTAMERRLGRSR